jgi:hypothetical protein
MQGDTSNPLLLFLIKFWALASGIYYKIKIMLIYIFFLISLLSGKRPAFCASSQYQ